MHIKGVDFVKQYIYTFACLPNILYMKYTLNEEVSQYVEQADGSQRPVLQVLREMIHGAVPGLLESIKWGRPVFSASSDFAYVKAAKNHVTLGFFSGQKLDDPEHLLEGSGKDMRHLKIKSVEQINTDQIIHWIKQVAV
jgi:hypothetical protein